MLSHHARQPLTVNFPACGVWAGESRHERGFVMPEVAHDFVKLLYAFGGQGWIERGGCRSPFHAGDVVLVPAGCLHRLEDVPRRPLSLYVVCLRREVVAALPGAGQVLAGYRHFAKPAWGSDLRDAVRRVLHEQTLAWPGGDALVWSAAWSALGLVWRMSARGAGEPGGRSTKKGSSCDPARARVAAYADGLATSFLNAHELGQVAESLGLSRRRFTQLFREVAGDSWKQVVRNHQVEHACRLLKETGRSMVSISYECGFNDVTSFHRSFRAVCRKSPARWRADS